MAKESKSVLDAIKSEINKSNNGAFKSFFKIRESGAKVRLRFLQNFEDCTQIVFHDKWNGFNHPCLEQYGKKCPNCDNPEARTRPTNAYNSPLVEGYSRGGFPLQRTISFGLNFSL